MSALLEWQGITVRHGTRVVLDNVSLQGSAGEFIALLGANGAGKSTLLDVATGYQRPEAGVVWLAGRPRSKWSARERAQRLSHLPQTVPLAGSLTVEELVAQARYPFGPPDWHLRSWFTSRVDAEAIELAMSRTGCLPWRERPLQSLSGGERQRVLLAAVLAQGADTVLLDEPSTYLDIAQQLATFQLMRDEADRGRLVIAVTHDLNLALRFCTRLVILAEGCIGWDLSTAQALDDSRWLTHFSPKLQLQSPADREEAAWISYR